MHRQLASAVVLIAATTFAQQTPTPPLQSHQLNPDNSITFRLSSPSAHTVSLSTDAALKSLPMSQDAAGIWTVTTPPLPPEIYSYSFRVDGINQLDPYNDLAVPNILGLADQVLVPGHPPMPWERSDIPHGEVNHHYYTSHIVQHLPDNQSGYVVYTPPHYDPKRKGGYPVLYLLHGWSDYAGGWVEVGKANFILDSMIDSGRAVPMIVVMPLGYGDYNFVAHGESAWDDAAKVDRNAQLFANALEGEVMPAVDAEYNIAKGRENHAIIGLSMGGLESLYVGLNHTDQFAWIGSMSAAIKHRDFDQHIPHIDAKSANLRLLWVACGTSDDLITPNRDFAAWAKSKGLPVTPIETPGKHAWVVWRDNLLHFAPLLFRKP